MTARAPAQHTPGPWTMYWNSPDADGTESWPSIMAMLPLGSGLFHVAQANRHEDARLIAAAPDLLAALEAIRDEAKRDSSHPCGRIFERAVVAIAAARGEARS